MHKNTFNSQSESGSPSLNALIPPQVYLHWTEVNPYKSAEKLTSGALTVVEVRSGVKSELSGEKTKFNP